MLPDDYQYDVFISYRRTDPVRGWVRNHFHPLLDMWLKEQYPPGYKPAVFIDQMLETGGRWADDLRTALQRSRCLVCVWSPSYFGQDWCLAEWRTMCAREERVRAGGAARPRLVYPVRLIDGERYPADARDTQHADLSRFNNPHPTLRKSALFNTFDRRMQAVAAEVAAMARAAPPWDPDWPVVPAGPVPPPPPVPLPRL